MSKSAENEVSVEVPEGPKDNDNIASNGTTAANGTTDAPAPITLKRRILAFLEIYDFPILIVICIGLAKLYPPLGAHYLRPDITASWLSVALIFFCMGLSLRSEQVTGAFKQLKFNTAVFFFNFIIVSAFVFGVSRLLVKIGAISRILADGMVICSCLPVSINAVVILSQASKGDVAVAMFHAAFGNMIGIFLSPVLILMYLGKSGNVDLPTVFYQLTLRVIVPVIIGQILRFSFVAVVEFAKKYKFYLSKAQQYLLIYAVYCVFCGTFAKGKSAGVGQVFLMVLFQFLLMITVMISAWTFLRLFFRDMTLLRVTGLFACSQKTIALGVPLIAALYQGNPNKGLYTLPILVWHPTQLVVGSLLVSRLQAFIKRENERLGVKDEDDAVPSKTPTEVEEAAVPSKPPTEVEEAADVKDVNDAKDVNDTKDVDNTSNKPADPAVVDEDWA